MSDPQRDSRIEFIGKWAIDVMSRLVPFFCYTGRYSSCCCLYPVYLSVLEGNMINVARDPWRNGLLLFEKDVWEWWTFSPQILAPRYFFVILFRNTEFKNDEPKVQEHVVKNCLLLYLWYFFIFHEYIMSLFTCYCSVWYFRTYIKAIWRKKNPKQKIKDHF